VLKIFFIFISLAFFVSAQGQSRFVLKVIAVDNEQVFTRLIKYRQNFPDSLSPGSELSRMVNLLHKKDISPQV